MILPLTNTYWKYLLDEVKLAPTKARTFKRGYKSLKETRPNRTNADKGI